MPSFNKNAVTTTQYVVNTSEIIDGSSPMLAAMDMEFNNPTDYKFEYLKEDVDNTLTYITKGKLQEKIQMIFYHNTLREYVM